MTALLDAALWVVGIALILVGWHLLVTAHKKGPRR